MDTQYSSNRCHTKGTYAFVSLGCPKNLVDSERMLGLLQLDGYRLVDEPDGSDFVIVNTCGFIEQARQESYQTIDEMLDLKHRGRTRGVIVAGCLAERQREQMLQDRPQIDSLVGVFGREEVTRVADRLLGNLAEQRSVFQPAPIRALSDHDRLRITPPHVAYLKISEGCDRLCTFCAIPQMRGKHASKPIEEIVSEARQLVASGTRELILVAQDTTYYGTDLYGEPRLTELLKQLDVVDGLDWIRLMYFYPMYIDDALIDTISSAEKILPYIDMPLQHINDDLLRRMARRVTRRETEALIDKLRDRIPGLTLRTTLITGFPGETDSQFEELADFVRRRRFERLGVFTYSYEDSTPSARLAGQLSETIKRDRRDELMRIQQEIAFAWSAAQIGRQQDVILDRRLEDDNNVWVGRTIADAPDVDSVALVSEDQHALCSGALVGCEIVANHQYDLVGVATGPPR
ncbi:MAG: 30S ribosomal protein S12 methylthiotransferase RimO [Planctomycetaceae bacterium]|nr:30S ribosomal protein S12 methylthiotransferase RimO [Planctomycetaceae bacterium]